MNKQQPHSLRFGQALLLALMLCLVAGASHAAEADDLVWGRFAWESKDYAEASARLSAFKAKAGKQPNYPVDYMIATAWCRLPGLEEKGLALLTWLGQQPLTAALRDRTTIELKACTGAAEAKSPPLALEKQKGASVKSIGNNRSRAVNKLPA
jgi:hypothetical protein